MSIAPLVDAWRRWLPGSLGTPVSSGQPASTPVDPRVEIFVDEAWINISVDVRYASRIRITGGRPDESGALQRGTCKFTLNNRHGKYSPRNPTSPYYGKIGRNTPCRVSVGQAGTRRYRFHGEITAWPTEWDVSGQDVFVQIEASGILRRLNQGVRPLRSSMYRTLIRETLNPVRAYWPCEDSSASTSIASGLSNAAALKITGTVSVASYSGFDASAPIPTLGAGGLSGVVPSYTVDDADEQGQGPYLTARFLLNIPSGGITNTAVLFRMTTTSGTLRWDVSYLTTSSGTLRLVAYDTTGTSFGTTVDTAAAVNGKDVMVTVDMYQDTGIGGVFGDLTVTYTDGTTETSSGSTFSGAEVGRVTRIDVAPLADCSGASIGQIFLQTDPLGDNQPTSQSLLNGWSGEAPVTRLARLCAEEGINFTPVQHGTSGGDTTMGPQGIKTFVALLTECAESDLGMLYEPRDQFGLAYRTRLSLYNQTTKLSLSYTDHDLREPAVPVDDDQQAKNDIEVKRDGGSAARAVLETGPLSTQKPPNGIGLYDDSATISLGSDAQLADQASWRLHLGTVDEPRYPKISVHLQRPTFVSSYDLTAAALTTELGDRIAITDPPSHQPPDDISVLAQSFDETFDQFQHEISWNGAPESPYRVAVADNTVLGKADTAGSALSADITAAATSFTVTTTLGPTWVTDAGEFPFDVTIGGEVMTVTAVSSDTSPQTFTVTRSTNNVVKAHLAGADVRLTHPMTLAL